MTLPYPSLSACAGLEGSKSRDSISQYGVRHTMKSCRLRPWNDRWSNGYARTNACNMADIQVEVTPELKLLQTHVLILVIHQTHEKKSAAVSYGVTHPIDYFGTASALIISSRPRRGAIPRTAPGPKLCPNIASINPTQHQALGPGPPP